MNPWEAANYLVKAKKNIDSLLYVKDNINKISLQIRKDYFDRIRDNFYINCCNVIDEYTSGKTSKKKLLCESNPIIDRLYHERDRNSAHIDERYETMNYNSFDDLVLEMKNQIREVKIVVKSILPDVFEINYFPHDKVLFRLINKIDLHQEDEIFKTKHMNNKEGFTVGNYSEPKNIVYDIKDLRNIPNDKKDKFAVLMQPGLNFYEFLQNLQDFYILINCTFDENAWIKNVDERVYAYEQLLHRGAIDIFDRPKKLKIFRKEFMEWCYITAEKMWRR